jgi:DNA helicase-2/ATP-dependent DNA helicase PcrA
MVPQRFHVHQQETYGDRHVYASLTRFIPNALTGLFDRRVWPAPTPEAGDDRAGGRDAGPTIDLAARVRALWR